MDRTCTEQTAGGRNTSRDFKIHRCLIKFPKGAEPVVELNEEIIWVATIKQPKDASFEPGGQVFLWQVESVETVDPPTHNGERVAFIFLYWTGIDWRLIFDCTPNIPGDAYQPCDTDDWQLGRTIADSINLVLHEYAIYNHDIVQAAIQAIGLWAAPALLPYPLTAIVEKCKNGDPDAARRILVDHCNSQFLRGLAQAWRAVAAVAARQTLFDDALAAHEIKQYTLSISALVPHVEGVITDWVYSQLPATDVPFRQESKTKKLRDVLSTGVQRTFTNQRVAESVVNFILHGPLLATFTDWLLPVPDSFPNRNIVGHGKYDNTLYTKENSIKVFLLLDTLFKIMSWHQDPSSS